MIHQDVAIPVEGTSMSAYLARPEEGSGTHAAVIIIPEIYGITPEMRAIADHMAGAGGVALAINFYHRVDPNFSPGYGEAGMHAGVAAAKTVTRASLHADVAAAIAWLNAQEFVRAGYVATWGFCIGGAVAFVTADLPGLRGAVCFYGGQITRPFMSGEPEGLSDVDKVGVPLLLVYGGEDTGIPADAITRTAAALESAGKAFQIQTYPKVGHAFFRHGTQHALAEKSDQSDEAVAEASADAWHLTLAFFKKIFDTAVPEKPV
ncbi:MAG: dienelactone hydrolase family protein [Candidatus Eremiobacteraeota bacterium]|nr:dienelactone hydrolase family protein [Candidatus Eremiobacteraeota bacterium]